MRKLIVIFFISFFFISCEDDMDCCSMPPIYNLELRYDGDRLEFSRISILSNPASSPALPEHAFDFNSNNQSFEIYGLKNTSDVYVTLTFFCTADGEFHTEEVKADFYDDKTTVLLIETVIGCEPTIQVIYE
tara:strand:+ start:22 stop:417 length:396 start_codon:yes stop_codon:yes gene_type:complete